MLLIKRITSERNILFMTVFLWGWGVECGFEKVCGGISLLSEATALWTTRSWLSGNEYQLCFCSLLDWVPWRFTPILHLTVFGDKTFKMVIKLKMRSLVWALIQYMLVSFYKKRKLSGPDIIIMYAKPMFHFFFFRPGKRGGLLCTGMNWNTSKTRW